MGSSIGKEGGWRNMENYEDGFIRGHL